MRYLGPQVHWQQRAEPEVKQRLAAVRAAFNSSGSFWTQPGVPKRWKRCMLVCKVQNAALTCLVPFLLTDVQCKRLDKAIAACGRVALMGKAYCEKGEVKSCMSTGEILKDWRLAPCATELQVRRIRWMQSWAASPQENEQVLATMFGKMEAESCNTVDEEGRLTADAHPWALWAMADLRAMADMDDAILFLEAVQDRIARVFSDRDLAEWFCSIDATALRAKAIITEISQEAEQGHKEEEGALEGEEGGYRCAFGDCGRWFSDLTTAFSHIRKKHGVRALAHVITTTNTCIVCRQVFATKEMAGRHLALSLRRGYCGKDRTRTLQGLMDPGSLQCGACEYEAGDLDALCMHAREHLPWPVLPNPPAAPPGLP